MMPGLSRTGVERADQPLVLRRALETGLVGPAHHGGGQAVVDRALRAGQAGRVEQRQAATQMSCVHGCFLLLEAGGVGGDVEGGQRQRDAGEPAEQHGHVDDARVAE